MAGTYKTPNVYVEEITKLPPSVAEVDTAVPAFIGYTEKAQRFVADDLIKKPTRISSLLDYVQYFGQGPSYSSIHVQLDINNVVDTSTTVVNNSIYNLYDSMRLFFDNGGGVCYICSVDKYSSNDNDATRATKITEGLAEVRKFDEPTILLFPDAVNIKTGGAVDWDKIAGIQQAALKQCGDLGDRFAVLDVPDDPTKLVEEEADLFRSKIGMNNLKYGAAYSPYVKTIYDKEFRLRDIMKNLFDSTGTALALKSLFKDTDKDASGTPIKTKLDTFSTIYASNDLINARLAVYTGSPATDTFSSSKLDASFQGIVNSFNGAANDAARLVQLKAAFEFVYYLYAQFEGFVVNHATPTNKINTATPATPTAALPIITRVIGSTTLRASVEDFLASNLKNSLQTFRNLDNEAYRIATPDISNVAASMAVVDFTLFTDAKWVPGAAVDSGLITGATLVDKGTQALNALTQIFRTAKSGLDSVVSMGLALESATEDALTPDLPIYNSILSVLNTSINTLPPSGAVAGVYASVDRDRGVWKAPGNVSINSVSDVSELIDDDTQEGLNVDPNAGKSINAIRAFYGKGILVWGVRTLAGNDNEWRYISVRRFFSFVEESCKKSTSWCVFEPNDANTWARIRGQIDNFLNNQWRQGALAGAKPEQAYYINCGLGITMTSQDILEGRLIVEIGMAAVRPAEFVILRFSHKLQQ
ncbi:phage tail sheath C-terminal domain-containing protein [Mucilaginibacter sp.]|jgi:phage tail sheath protein FI|uniref:phage tail sheath C-terminal domain-containing protein n=1 Tax=Mucilaginibacter sp. TaxID=1882438 RepID=UPI002BF63C52|nr:phage tail sheath C-terminal domain-containing protein [Mucilaginibacter sp.]HTI61065.1 phage tail sheath C-terminal domain-containing protein [Mucilaginibacter sp.]